MFVTAQLTTAKKWKQLKCPDEWVKKTWYIQNGILISHRKEGNEVICSNMDKPRDYHIK